jgi:hypothetical protein
METYSTKNKSCEHHDRGKQGPPVFLAFYEKRLPHALFHDGFRVSAERKKVNQFATNFFHFIP